MHASSHKYKNCSLALGTFYLQYRRTFMVKTNKSTKDKNQLLPLLPIPGMEVEHKTTAYTY